MQRREYCGHTYSGITQMVFISLMGDGWSKTKQSDLSSILRYGFFVFGFNIICSKYMKVNPPVLCTLDFSWLYLK